MTNEQLNKLEWFYDSDEESQSLMSLSDKVLTLEISSQADDPESETDLAKWVGSTLKEVRTITALLESLEVKVQPDYSGELNRAWLVALLKKHVPASIRSLYWGCDWGSCFVEIPDLRALRRALPCLNRLQLPGEWHHENQLDTQHLSHLGLNALSIDAIESITELDLSKIDHLELWLYDHENEGAEILTIEDLLLVFEMPLPMLRRLTLHACEFGPELLNTLPGTPIFDQLDELRLLGATDTGSYLDASCAEVLLSPEYATIPSIEITRSFCDPTRDPQSLLDRLIGETSGRIHVR